MLGATGEGKTTYYKNKFKSDRQTICYLRIPSDFEGENAIVFTNFMKMLHHIRTKKNKKVFVDEAWTCFPKKLEIKMDNQNHPHNILADYLVNARKMNNFFTCALHSFKQMPEWMPTYLDYVIRFNTLDQFQYQAKRFSAFPIIEHSLTNEPIIKEKIILNGITITKPKILKLR